MSDEPISAADPGIPAPVAAALKRAGWPVEAWLWEQAMLAGLTALADGDPAAAHDRFREAQALAERTLPADDLRQVTAAANLAKLDGDRAALAGLADRWSAGEVWLTTLRPHRPARSSSFHLRLETKHPGGYDQLQAARLRRLWRDGGSRLSGASSDRPAQALAVPAMDRWRAATASIGFVDTRKLGAASVMLLG